MTNEEKANLIFRLCYEYFMGVPRGDLKDARMEKLIQNIIEDKHNADNIA